MKPNPERNWSIQFWSSGDDYHQVFFRGTIDGVLAKADEEECEFDWEVTRMSFVALG